MMERHLAYCTNVHAGSDLDDLLANLNRYSLPVKERFAPERPMGVGLWIAAPAARTLLAPQRLTEFSKWLSARDLVPFTLNGFPFGDFHDPVVKHRVYHPTWFESDRRDYTLDLIQILHGILPENLEGSISTLPIAWRRPEPTDQQLLLAARYLGQVAEELARLEEKTGRLIAICLEPEPGCILQECDDVLWFFDHYLRDATPADLCARYIRTCHDICHAAVMFEDQQAVLKQYAAHDIRVGKVQISSAIEANFNPADPDHGKTVLNALAPFAEGRYLHQTSTRSAPDATPLFFDDLPAALAAANQDPYRLQGTWRVHFHVPIYLEQIGPLGTSQSHIQQCLHASRWHPDLAHFEVETYAWSVLPPSLQSGGLAEGIAREMNWARDQLSAESAPRT